MDKFFQYVWRNDHGMATPGPDPKIAPYGAKELESSNPEFKKYLWSGRILHVDTETMCCSLALDTSVGEFHDVPLPAAAGGGPRSWAGVVPEPGTKVVVGWKKFGHRTHQPVIIEVLTSGVFPAREFEPFMSLSPGESAEALAAMPELEDDPRFNWQPVRLKLRKVYPGEFLASSSGGADIYLDKDVNLSNRAGNEFILRDADQTAVLQIINEFTSNAAGVYRRGLIKRNAFTFYQDLFPLFGEDSGTAGPTPYEVSDFTMWEQKVPTSSPAFKILRNFGLIDEQGKRVANYNDTYLEYPYIVAADGQRINYISTGENTNSFAESSFAYVEDRMELRHYSNGVMAVTEEGDGFQVDYDKETYIEDVHGTVVGNDFSTDAGRPLYKKILRMKVFPDPLVGEVSPNPIFEPVDNFYEHDIIDQIALARLYRIQSPKSSNQYAFGISKEGRVFIHVPASQVGTPDEAGKSVDLNIVGLLKAIIGKDPNTQLSADVILNGGLNCEIGRGPKGSSIILTLHGPIKKNIIGDDNLDNTPTEDTTVGGSTSTSISGSSFTYVRGTVARISGASDNTEADSIVHNAGAGGYKQLVAGDRGITVLGKTMEMFAQLKTCSYALGITKTTLAGVDSTTQLVGAITRTLVSGAGITDSVGVGNYACTVGTGNMLMSTGAGNIAITCGAGNLALTATAGPLAITSSLTTNITSAVSTLINSPFTKIGTTGVGNAVAGIPGPPAPHFDYVTGLPLLGVPTVVVG